MTEREKMDAAADAMIVRAFIYQSGQSVEMKAGTLEEIFGVDEATIAFAFTVDRPGRQVDFFAIAGVPLDERAPQGFTTVVGDAGQLAVTLDDGSPVITYAPQAWLECRAWLTAS